MAESASAGQPIAVVGDNMALAKPLPMASIAVRTERFHRSAWIGYIAACKVDV